MHDDLEPERRPPPRLRLIRGGLGRPRRWHSLDIVAAPDEDPPFPIDARVVEEDTYLVLSAAPEVVEPGEPMVRLMTAVHDAVPEPVGSVVVRSGRPSQFLAVVHDLAAEPTWTEEGVGSAYAEIFRLATARRSRALGLPLLATRHGRMPPGRSLALVGEALARRPPGALERLWLIIGDADEASLLDALAGMED